MNVAYDLILYLVSGCCSFSFHLIFYISFCSVSLVLWNFSTPPLPRDVAQTLTHVLLFTTELIVNIMKMTIKSMISKQTRIHSSGYTRANTCEWPCEISELVEKVENYT